MDPAAMQAKSMELEASLVTATGALQQLSTQQAVHSAPKPPKPPKPDKFQGDRSGAASNWLHQMTLYQLSTQQAVHSAPKPPNPPNRPTPSPPYLGPQPMQLGALTRRPPTERHRLLRGKQSFRCHQLGHRARERTPSTTVRPTTSSTQEQPRD